MLDAAKDPRNGLCGGDRGRTFLAALSLTIGRALLAIALGTPAARAVEVPTRIVQTLLREPDAADYNPARVVAYLQSVRADCVVINGGGLMDFFPSDEAMSRPAAALRGRDLVAELTAACHRVGIRVLARVDFRGVEEVRWRQHPGWFSVDADGQPSREGELFRACFNSPYRDGHGLDVVRRLIDTCGVDGIWYNSPQAVGACYCPVCAEKYRAATGAAIPRTDGSAAAFLGPSLAEYRALKARWAAEHLARLRDLIKARGAERLLVVETFGLHAANVALMGGIDLLTIAPSVDFLAGKAYSDDSDEPSYPGDTVRLLRALAPEKTPVLLASVQRNKFRLVADDPVRAQAWLWEGVAAGGGAWNVFAAGAEPAVFADRRGARVAAPVFALLAAHGPELAGRRPVTEASVYFSSAARDRAPESLAAAVQGATRVLAQNHVPYGFTPSVNVSATALAGVKVLLLPAGTALADPEIAVIRDYVANGGNLIAECDATLFDGHGVARKEFGLADVLGVSFTGTISEKTRNSPHQIRVRHEMFRGWEDTDILLNGGRMALCRATEATALATRIPAPPASYPEEAWIRKQNTDDATITVHRFGRGTAVYFAHEIMRLSREDGHPDFAGLLASAVNFCRGAKLLETDAPPTVHTSLLTDGAGGYTLCFVNHAPTLAEPEATAWPISEIHAVLRLEGKKLQRAVELEGGDVVETHTNTDGTIDVRVRRLDAFAAVALTVR